MRYRVAARTMGCLIACMLLAGSCTSSGSGSASVSEATPSASGSAQAPHVLLQQRAVLAVASGDTLNLTCTPNECTSEDLAAPTLVLQGRDGSRYRLGAVVWDGSNVASAKAVSAGMNGSGVWFVDIELDEQGTAQMASASAEAVSATPPRNQLALVLDGQVILAPVVQSPIDSGQVQITSGWTEREATALAAKLSSS